MRNHISTNVGWKGYFPQGRSAVVSLVVIAIVAFVLGGLLFGGGDADSVDGHAHSASSAEPQTTQWTCSMHPQIQLPKAGKCPICFMDLIPVESDSRAGELDPRQIRMSSTATALAGIQTTPVTRAWAERSIRMVGKLAYDETKVANIAAWAPGRLDRLFIDFTGATVAKGDPMVEMYSPELIAAQEELLQAYKAVDDLRQTSSPTLKSTAERTVASAREKLRLYGLSESQIQDVIIRGTPSERLTLVAPASGVVVHKDAREGLYVATGARIYTIADLTRLWLMLEAYETDLPWLRAGQKVAFSSPAYPGETFDAVVDFIDPVVDPSSRTVAVRAVVDNVRGRLKPDMFVSGTVVARLDDKGNILATSTTTSRKDNRADNAPLLIPISSPLLTGKRALVYVQVSSDDGAVFEGREVTLGPRAGDYYVVKEGLSEGELVVTNGAFKIDSELQIQAKPSMMSPGGDRPVPGHDHSQSAHSDSQPSDRRTAAGPYRAGDAKRIETPIEARQALSPVYQAYFDVQMALANDDVESTLEAYTELRARVEAVDMDLFPGDAHGPWMMLSAKLTEATEAGAGADDIAAARDAFYHTSLAAIELHDTFGHAAESPFYLTYCPMARNNEGAYWLQEVNIVWNSFYGDMMLRCGEIKRELPSGDPE